MVECFPDSKACGHASRSVNFGQVKKTLKQGQAIGECTQCRKGHCSELNSEPNPIVVSLAIVPYHYVILVYFHKFCITVHPVIAHFFFNSKFLQLSLSIDPLIADPIIGIPSLCTQFLHLIPHLHYRDNYPI